MSSGEGNAIDAFDISDVARRFVASLVDGAGPAPEIFADEVSLWWNVRPDGQRLAGEIFAHALSAGHPPAHMSDYRLEAESVRLMDDGFILALAVKGTTSDGRAVAAHVCQIVTVAAGKIVRWEEYLDQGQHEPFHS